MSFNSEQFPNEDITTKSPHAGGSEVPDDVREQPVREYRDTPLREMAGKLTPPNDFNEGFVYAPLTKAELALQSPEKKKNKLAIFLAAGLGGAAVIAASTIMSVNAITGNGLIKNPADNNNLPPTSPEPVASAPVTPGEVTPTPTFEAPAKPVAVTPEAIANYDELVDGAKITKGEFATWDSIRTEFANQFTDMMNFQPSEAQLEASKDLVSEKSGLVGPEALAEQYRKAFSPLFRSGGELPNILEAKGFDTFKKWYQTRNEENPYKVTMAYNTETKLYEITDNVNLNSLPDDPNGTTYNITGDIKLSNFESGQTIDDAYYQMPGNSPITKVGTIPNQ